MTDPTDLSKLSSTEIIAKIVNLALGCDDSVWTNEANAKLHVLSVVLKQAVIREASVGTCTKKERFEQNEAGIVGSWRTTEIDPPDLPDGIYDLVSKETR